MPRALVTCGRHGAAGSGSSSRAAAALCAAAPTSPSISRAEVLTIAALDSTELDPSASGPGSTPRSAARTSASTSPGRPRTSSIQARARHIRGSIALSGRPRVQASTVASSPPLTKSSQLAAISSAASW